MRVLGIDPGLALTGWGLVEKKDKVRLINYGCIRTSKLKESCLRLGQIYEKLLTIIKKHQPEVICVEKVFFNTNAKTAFSIGEARGVIKVCSLLNKIPLYEFTPLQVKSSVVGYGRADKNQVQQMVKVTLGLSKIPKPDDAADALAVALTFCCYNKDLED